MQQFILAAIAILSLSVAATSTRAFAQSFAHEAPNRGYHATTGQH